MTLFNIISAVEERFSYCDTKEVTKIVRGLEQRIIDEIFSPYGIELSVKCDEEIKNIYAPLILNDEHILLYVYYVFSVLALKEMDIDSANAYSVAFNEKFAELSALYRRKNVPVKNTKLSGGV